MALKVKQSGKTTLKRTVSLPLKNSWLTFKAELIQMIVVIVIGHLSQSPLLSITFFKKRPHCFHTKALTGYPQQLHFLFKTVLSSASFILLDGHFQWHFVPTMSPSISNNYSNQSFWKISPSKNQFRWSGAYISSVKNIYTSFSLRTCPCIKGSRFYAAYQSTQGNCL